MLKRIFVHSGKHYIAAVSVGLVLTLLMLWKNGFTHRIAYMDALTMAGGALILLGLLFLVARLGAFDIFAFSLTTLHGPRRYHTLYDYTEAKTAKRRKTEWTFVPYIAVGVLLMAVGFLIR